MCGKMQENRLSTVKIRGKNMDKITALIKNVWFRRSVAVLCWGYTGFLIWVSWLCLGYYFELENPTPLFVLYLFINIAAFGLLIFTRKQVITQINAYVLPVIVFLILIFGFGKWYITTPPLAVVIAMFFINKSNETLKTVLGTMYLLIYVIGVVGFIAVRMFMGNITFTLDETGTFSISERDFTQRDPDYEKLSDSGDYRIVRYIEEAGGRKTVSYYVEYTGDDIKIPMGICKKVAGCRHLHTTEYTGDNDNQVRWGTQTVDGKKTDALYVEGLLRENPYLIKIITEDVNSDSTESSSDAPESSSESSSSDESN